MQLYLDGNVVIEYFQSLTAEVQKVTSENDCVLAGKFLILCGGQRRNRTADAGVFGLAAF
jgi:hypothetical protein